MTKSTPPTTQEIFDIVVNHLIKQGCQSLLKQFDDDGEPGCAYRGQDGTKCAIGILIKDKHYRPKFENNSVGNTCVREAIGKSIGRQITSTDEFILLTELQKIHDTSEPAYWVDKLKFLAKKRGLKFNYG